MQVQVAPGKYVIAVSGGVDSMVLLDVLRRRTGVELVVAHFDHGIRPDSAQDRQLVQRTAEQHNLLFIYDKGHLGAGASEATARAARRAFLQQVREGQGAVGIITAHHQGDVLEAAILNWSRGLSRKGFAALHTPSDMLRPFLQVTKNEILAYAAEHQVVWREDSTNTDQRYRRNYIRKQLELRLNTANRRQLLAHIKAVHQANTHLDQLLTNMLHSRPTPDSLERSWFISLPHGAATEVLAAWLRYQGVRSFDRKLIARLAVAAKTAAPGKSFDINGAHQLAVKKSVVQITPRDLRQNSGGHV